MYIDYLFWDSEGDRTGEQVVLVSGCIPRLVKILLRIYRIFNNEDRYSFLFCLLIVLFFFFFV